MIVNEKMNCKWTNKNGFVWKRHESSTSLQYHNRDWQHQKQMNIIRLLFTENNISEREWGMMKAKNIHRDILHREPIPVECKYIWKMYNRQVFRLSTDFNFGILRLDSNTAVTIPSLM